MDVYFTRRSVFDHLGGPRTADFDAEDYRAILDDHHIPEEMPFLLDQHGSYDGRLNAFLRSLPVSGGPSPQSWKGYAYDIACAQRFLDERRGGLHILDATYEDMAAYRNDRRSGSPPSVAASTWNRGLAALEKLYGWGMAVGHVDASPFKYRGSHSMAVGSFRVNTLAERLEEDEGVKCVTMREYRIFRDIGLDGRVAVGGVVDEEFRGRNRKRNLAVSDYLLNTGARITETVSLLQAEIPRLGSAPGEAKLIPMRLAPYVAKRRRGRRVMVSERTMRLHILPYIAKDRAHAVAVGLERHYGSITGATLVKEAQFDRCRLHGGGTLHYAGLDARVRRKHFMVDENGAITEPAMLFLSEDGMPTTDANIRAVFERASVRCRAAGYDIDISPHVLRHTFAVCMLTQLMRATLRRHDVGSLIDFRTMDPARELFRAVTLDPVDHLRRLLGHRSVKTTYRYLTYVQEAEDAVSDAFAEWDKVIGAPPPVEEYAEEA